jgi:hypothetical protein
MAVRIDVTTATAESASFSPTDDFIVQKTALHPSAVFDVMARVDANADWMLLESLNADENFARFAKMPFVKIVLRENLSGKAAKAWTDA